MNMSGSFVERWGRYTMQPGSVFITAATCSFKSAASASPLPFAARIFAATVSTSAIALVLLAAPASTGKRHKGVRRRKSAGVVARGLREPADLAREQMREMDWRSILEIGADHLQSDR